MQNHTIATRLSLRRRWLAQSAAALLAVGALAALPGRAHAGVFVSVNIAPPALPVYAQPAIPGPGYIWTPGYWAWSDGGYYWVPGTWVLAPFTGALWTPGYWGWNDGVYVFHAGYWGLHVGFYGGIAYGFGYGGVGYEGGHWGPGGFYYNRTVNHVTNNITNVYNKTVINKTVNITRVSYNGGPHGVMAQPSAQELRYAHERHVAPLAAQVQQREMASHVQSLRAAVNHGAPPVAATPRAGAFAARNVTHAQPRAASVAASRASDSRATESAPQREGALRSASFNPHTRSMPMERESRGEHFDRGAPGSNDARPNEGEHAREPAHDAAANAHRVESYPHDHAQPASYGHPQAPREREQAAPRPVHHERPENHERRPDQGQRR